MSDAILDVRGLRVDYDDVTAVDDVSFSVVPGMVFGLIGPNGAGKTTVIRTLAGLQSPTWGEIRVSGIDLVHAPLQALHRLGYMPDFPPLYEDLTVGEFLDIFASAYGIPREERRDRVRALVEMVQLTEKFDAMAGDLSRGMKQRLFLAKTLLHDPDLLLLDEPASGLDPRARLELRDIIIELGRRGKAVVVSSHILAEMADFCNSVGIMEAGRMVISGRVDEIVARLRPGVPLRIRLLTPHDGIGAFLDGWEGVSGTQIDGVDVHLQVSGDEPDAAMLLKALIGQGFPVVEFRREGGDLEDIFLRVSTGRVS